MYHRLDGKLVAVGCLDLLSKHMDSVYFFYDPEYRFLNLGVVGALKEIEWCRMVRKLSSPQRFEWYVLSDFVSVCPKVSYKTQY
jgi:arginine-tRNA-protein transferase